MSDEGLDLSSLDPGGPDNLLHARGAVHLHLRHHPLPRGRGVLVPWRRKELSGEEECGQRSSCERVLRASVANDQHEVPAGSNYTCRPSDLASGLTKLSEEVCTSLDRGSFFTAQDKFTRLHPGDEGNICATLAAELLISGKQASGAANLREHAAKLNEKPLMQLMLVMMLSAIAPYIYFGADDELVARLCRTSVYYNAMVFALSRFTVILLLNMKFFGKKTILDLRLPLIVMFDVLAVYVSGLSTVKLGPMSLMVIFLVSGLLLLLCWLYAKWSTSRKYNLIENKTLPRIPHGCIQTEKYQDAKHLTFGVQASGAASCPLDQQEEVTAKRFSVKAVEKMIKVVKISWLFLIEAPKKIKEGFRDYLRKPARSGEITIYMLMSVTMPLAVVLYFCFTAQLCRASMYCSATALALSLWAAMLLFNKVTPELRLVLLTDMHTPCLGALPFMESPSKSMIVAFLWIFVTDALFVDYRSHQGTIV